MSATQANRKQKCGNGKGTDLQLSKTKSIRKLSTSNFNFQWTKTLYQNNLNNIAFLFYIFQGL